MIRMRWFSRESDTTESAGTLESRETAVGEAIDAKGAADRECIRSGAGRGGGADDTD